MAKTIITLILLSLLVPCFLSYDYMKFVQTWPPTHCTIKPCSTPIIRNMFTIHGIWEAYNSPLRPPPCIRTSFSLAAVHNLEPQLNASWPCLRNRINNQWLWKHEWDEHGICLQPTLTVTTYFQLGLHLKNQFNLLNILRSSGHSPGRAYYKTGLKTAIQNATGGFIPLLKCVAPNSTRSLLYEVVICLDYQGRALINCPGTDSCPGPPKTISWFY